MTGDSRRSLIGPVGERVIANVEALRKARGLSFRDLADRLAEAGRPIGDTVLHRQSTGRRRIDADDLCAFAEVLGTTPTALLAMSGAGCGAEDHPAVRAAQALAGRLAALITAGTPEAAALARADVGRGLRRVQLEAEELLAGQAQ